MIIGVPTEVKNHEYRVGLVPGTVRTLTELGHEVWVQRGAGWGSGLADELYEQAGARMVSDAQEVWAKAEMIVKVKEPIEQEYALIRPRQTIFTFFHLAAVPELAEVLLEREVSAVAYETIAMPDGHLPLLEPMSEVAGKMAVQVAAQCLTRGREGKGILLGGVPGVSRAEVVVLGGGTVGVNAVKVALGMGARVCLLDVNQRRLSYLDDVFGGRLQTLYSAPDNIERVVRAADVVVGAVLIAGARTPQLVSRQLVAQMEPGSVVVDVAVDQGGCFETSRPTTHEQPTYVEEGVVHYCVSNMPGAVSRTSTRALNNATYRYVLALANQGVAAACAADATLLGGLNTWRGEVSHAAVAQALGRPHRAAKF